MQESVQQVAEVSAKAALPVAVSASSFLFSLDTWVYIVTLVYLFLQIGYVVYQWRGSHKDRRRAKEDRENANSD